MRVYELQYTVPSDSEHKWPRNESCMVITDGDARRACCLLKNECPNAHIWQCNDRGTHHSLIQDPACS